MWTVFAPCCNLVYHDCSPLPQLKARHMADHLEEAESDLYSAEDDLLFCSKLPDALKLVEDFMQESKAILPDMEAMVINLACDDSMEVLGPHLILPLIQRRLDGMQACAVCLYWQHLKLHLSCSDRLQQT